MSERVKWIDYKGKRILFSNYTGLKGDTILEFINEGLQGVLTHLARIDEMITTNLTNWKISRLSYVDRAIIRFATYELYLSNTPPEIIINEALNITRKYSDEGNNKMVGFTNKVLDNVAKYLKKV